MSKAARPEKLENGTWRVRWLDADGERKAKVFPKYAEAEKFLTARQAETERIKAGTEARPPEPHTFDELCDYWLEHRTAVKRSQKDDKSMIEAHLRPSFGGLELTKITLQRVDAYRRGRRHLSEKTLHNHLTLLISELNLAVELGWLATAPRIKKPKLIEEDYTWLKSTEQIRALLVAAQEEDPGVMELYATAVYTGMRAGELMGLTWDAVDLEGRLITVKKSYDQTTKTAAIRHVPILDPLLPVLREWKVTCWSSQWVFPSKKGTMGLPSARVLQDILKRCQDRMKVPEAERITFHDLRHTFASHFMMRSGDLFRLQRILGHKTVQMTNRYAHLAPEVFKEDYGRLVDVVPRSGEGEVIAMVSGEKVARVAAGAGAAKLGSGRVGRPVKGR